MAIATLQHQQRLAAALFGRARGVRQDHDRRLEALGAMNSHHPHFARALLHVALDLDLASLKPVDEARERGAMGFLVIERAVEEGVDRVIGLTAQPRHDAQPRRPEDGGKEFEGPSRWRISNQRLQEGHSAAEGFSIARAQALPQRHTAARRRDVDQLVFAQGVLQERTLEEAGQRVVVLRHDGELRQGHEVEHGNVLAQLQPVSTRHRHLLVPQCADHRVEEAVALPHQDEDVARLHGAVPCRQHALADPALDGGCELLRQPAAWRLRRLAVNRRLPRIGVLLFGWLDERPDFHGALRFAPVGHVLPFTRQAAIKAGARIRSRREDAVDSLQDGLQRAEGDAEVHFAELPLHALDLALYLAQHLLEDIGVRPLEGIDRLLPVTHHEQGARLAAVTAFACEELARQRLHDLPLHGAGVLRLVDEQVLDAAVELEQHPGGIRLLVQEFRRPDDEVLEVIGTTRPLGRLEAMHDGGSQPQQRQRGAKASEIAKNAQRCLKPRLIGFHKLFDPRVALPCRSIGDVGAGRVISSQQHTPQVEKARVPRGAGASQLRGRLPLRLCSGVESIRQFEVSLHIADETGRDAVARDALRERQVEAQQALGPLQPLLLLEQHPQVRALGKELGEQLVEVIGVHPVDNIVQGPADVRCFILCGGENGVAGLLQQVERLAVVQHGEMRNDAGLDRKELQHALAKGMDGLDLEAARCFQRTGEELAGPRQQMIIGIGRSKLLQCGAQCVVVKRDPLAQPVEEAVGHFRRRRLGEGEAHDARGLGAAQHEAHHTIDQNMGLAGARIGIDPHGGCRVGRLELRQTGRGIEAHAPPPDSVHSWKRER